MTIRILFVLSITLASLFLMRTFLITNPSPCENGQSRRVLFYQQVESIVVPVYGDCEQ